jgi:hypothetical protein
MKLRGYRIWEIQENKIPKTIYDSNDIDEDIITMLKELDLENKTYAIRIGKDGLKMKLEELIKDKKISCIEEGKITHLGTFNKKEGQYRYMTHPDEQILLDIGRDYLYFLEDIFWMIDI